MEAAGKARQRKAAGNTEQRKAEGKTSKQPQQEAEMNRNTDHNPLDCPVCMEAFDDTKQRPHTLPCGHTLCTLCINKLKDEGQLTCPECRIIHAVPDGGQFPICYVLESMIRRMMDVEAAAAAAAMPPPSAGKGKEKTDETFLKGFISLSRKTQSFLKEQETQVLAAITTCREVQSQLDQYQTTLAGWCEKQQHLENMLQGVIYQSSSARELVQQEESRALAKKKEAKEVEQQLQAVLDTLRSVTSSQEAGVVVSEVFDSTDKAEQVMEECQEGFPDVDIANTVREVTEDCRAALEAIQSVQAVRESQGAVAIEPELRGQADQHSTVTVRLQAILAPGVTTEDPHSLQTEDPRSLQTEDLRSLTQPAKRLLSAGRVFAVHLVEGQQRHASISLEGDQIYLHTLKEQPLPPGATTLQVSQVVPPSPPCTVFLDLSWPGSGPRRVQVRLPRDIPVARQFMLLCTGQRGASYANTRLLGVADKGKPGEFVRGGDYECNDGTGGAPLLPGLDEGGCWKSGQAGAVRWWCFDPARHGAQFAIITRDRVDGRRCGSVFGEVVQGLDVLVAAAQHHDIKQVTVVDCGVVLWV